jgi:hypothetical protein
MTLSGLDFDFVDFFIIGFHPTQLYFALSGLKLEHIFQHSGFEIILTLALPNYWC